jgi:hypothetical protein
MSGREQLAGRPFLPGHQYQHVQVNEGARAHLGDTYYISQFVADAKEEHHKPNTLQVETTLLASYRSQPFNLYGRQHEPTCLPNIRVGVPQKIHNGLIAKTSNFSSC